MVFPPPINCPIAQATARSATEAPAPGRNGRRAQSPCHHLVNSAAGFRQGDGGDCWAGGWAGQGELMLSRASEPLPRTRRELTKKKAQALPFDPQKPSGPAMAV